MKPLPDKWAEFLTNQPETGMGYWVVSVTLSDERVFDRVVIDSGYITKIYGLEDVPFDANEITDIKVTHDKWNFDQSNNAI